LAAVCLIGWIAGLGPGFFDTDLSLVKRIRVVGERTFLTFRAEAYNLFNTVNFNPPGVNLQTPQTFGVISSTPTGASNQSERAFYRVRCGWTSSGAGVGAPG
jgi:hypothetical protein